MIVVILLAVGLFLFLVKPGDKPTNSTDAKAWVETIMSQENIVESSIGFAIACLTLIGYLALISYTVNIQKRLNKHYLYSIFHLGLWVVWIPYWNY